MCGFCLKSILDVLTETAPLFISDFKTHVQARTDYYIPPGMIDFSITLSRGNLVKVFAVMVVVSICMFNCILITQLEVELEPQGSLP